MNGINSATGKTVGSLGGAVGGQSIGQLSKGTANYTAFINEVKASGGTLDYIVWYQGEGDSANGSGTSEATYRALLTQLHTDIVTDLGTTKAACPLVLCGLAVCTDVEGGGAGTSVSWDLIEGTLIRCGSGGTQIPNVYYSHSNRDGVLASGDLIHIDGTSLGRCGKRFAKTITSLLASSTAFPNWHIASAATVDATHTDVTFVHGLGSDFTPTSNPSGFDLSGDNGGTWAAATAGARQSATVLRLTHASLPTTNLRQLRYQYGLNPNVSAPVADNSSLSLPLDNSGGNIAPTPLASLPVPTWSSSSGQSNAGGTIQQLIGTSIGAAAARRIVIIKYSAGTDVQPSSITVAPNVGTTKTCTLVNYIAAGGSASAGIAYCVLDADADTATTVTTTLNYAANPFGSRHLDIYYLPSGDLNSTTPVDSKTASSAAATTLNISLNTSAGGFYIVGGASANISSNSGSLSATGETPTLRANTAVAGALHVTADASGVAAQAPDTITETFTASGAMASVGASWR